MNTNKGWFSKKFSLVPMLLTGESISPEARQALRENRLKDAADILMKEYGLTCVEAGQLLDVSACARRLTCLKQRRPEKRRAYRGNKVASRSRRIDH